MHLSKTGNPLTTVGEYLQDAEDISINEATFKVELFNTEAWARGILKIILALGHKVLGEEWTFGSMANVVRAYVMFPSAKWPVQRIYGDVVGEWDRRVRVATGKTAKVRDRQLHTVAILPASEAGEEERPSQSCPCLVEITCLRRQFGSASSRCL